MCNFISTAFHSSITIDEAIGKGKTLTLFCAKKILQKHYKFQNRSNSVEWKSNVFVEKKSIKIEFIGTLSNVTEIFRVLLKY